MATFKKIFGSFLFGKSVFLYYRLRCVLESLFIVYLSLFSHINTFNKNYKYFKELIKITYDPL